MEESPFRILCLSGGGVRGIFQAAFLKGLEDRENSPIHEQFGLIAGTSTGSIVALAIALGIDLSRVMDFYVEKSSEILKPRSFAGFRKGSRYEQHALRQHLSSAFANAQLRDVKKDVLIAATGSDDYSNRIFSSFPIEGADDRRLPVVRVP